MTTGRHALQRLYLAEDLVRRRRADEYRRQVASQRAARIDPNPHQIDAVIFALERIPDGGCILADEVGLGKTIEAGLVIAQLLAGGGQARPGGHAQGAARTVEAGAVRAVRHRRARAHPGRGLVRRGRRVPRDPRPRWQ